MAGLPIGHGPPGTVLIADVDPNRLHDTWQAADALVPVIGRRPVMVTDDLDDTLRIRPEPEPEPGPSESELRVRRGGRVFRTLAGLQPLPEALVIVDENDVLRDEGEAYARKLIAAGSGGRAYATTARSTTS